jgi:hypothetical protein
MSTQVEEFVEMKGHIIDSLLLTKVLNLILDKGAKFSIETIKLGEFAKDPSFARIEVKAESQEILEAALNEIKPHGAVSMKVQNGKV